MYFSFALLLRFGLNRKYQKKTLNPPSVSVIVSARNEAEHIIECMLSLNELDYPREKLEIILVNDRSSDETPQLLTRFINGKSQFRFINNEKKQANLSGKANAIARAIRESQGELIFITDADCVVAKDWLKKMVVYFTEKVGMVASFAALSPCKNIFSKLQNFDWLYLLSVAAGAAGLRVPLSCIGNNFAVRRSVYDEVGGYEGVGFSVAEDFALLKTVAAKTDWEIVFPLEAEATVLSKPVKSWKDLLRQRKRWAIGGLNVHWFGKLLVVTSFLTQLMIVISLTAYFNLIAGLGALTIVVISDMMLLNFSLQKLKFKGWWYYIFIYKFFSFFYILILGLNMLFNPTVIWKGEKYKFGKTSTKVNLNETDFV